MARRQPLTAAFVRTVSKPGAYGDGRRRIRVDPQSLEDPQRPDVAALGSTGADRREAESPRARFVPGRDPTRSPRRGPGERPHDPPGQKTRGRAGVPTFDEAARRTIEQRAKGWRNPETARRWASTLERYAGPTIGAKQVDAVTPADIVGVLSPIWATKKTQAAAVRERLAGVFAWCIGQGWISDSPVVAALASLPKQNGTNGNGHTVKHHAMTPDDARETLRQVAGASAFWSTRAAVRFQALTAARFGEVRTAEWSDIDEAAALWSIPAAKMKTGRQHRVPLSRAALAILNAAREHADGGAFVFPSSRGGPTGAKTAAGLLRRIGAAGTPHGFRGAFRSWAADEAVSREVAETCLAHQVGSKIERAYQRSDLIERRRDVLEHWAGVPARVAKENTKGRATMPAPLSIGWHLNTNAPIR